MAGQTKEKSVCNGEDMFTMQEVRTYSFRVVVHDYSFISQFLYGPDALYAAVVELDTLSDPDRT